jgi:hypothetical protein
MKNILMLLCLGALAFYGWHWFGPLSEAAAEDYEELCTKSLPGSEEVCRCTARSLQDNSRRFFVMGLWSSSPASQDRAQTKIMRDELMPCFARTRYIAKNCMRNPAARVRGAKQQQYCGCVNGRVMQRMPRFINQASRDAANGGNRFADTIYALVKRQEDSALQSCARL